MSSPVERIKSFASHHLVRKTLTLQIGGALGTLIQAVAGVVLARLLQPALYGRYALAFSVAAVSSIFIGGGLTDAIAPAISRAWARNDGEALRATVGFYLRFVAVCAAVTVIIAALLPSITRLLYHDASVGGLATIIVLASIISVSVFALVQLMIQVTGRIRTLALLTLADVTVRYAAMVTLVVLGFSVWGAVAGHFIGALIMCVIASAVYVIAERAHALLPRFREFIRLACAASWRPMLRPTLWVLTDSNFALLYGALPVALVGLFVTGAELAYFKLALGYILLAMSVMGPISTVLNVHFPTVQTTEPRQLHRTFVKATGSAVALSTAVTAIVVIISPWVFRLLYGSVYLPSIPYVYGFAVFGALFGLGVGLGPMWRATGKVKLSVLINVITLGLGVPLGLLFIRHWGPWGAVGMVTLWYTASHLASFLYLERHLRRMEYIGQSE